MATTSPVTTDLTCSQCGGELHPDEGQIFLTCPFCGATVYLDRSRVVFHWYVAPTLNDADAAGALYRWMSGSQTVKDLDKKAKVVGQSFQYFPVWYFKWQEQDKEKTALQPAAATSVSELASLSIPAGDLRKYDPSLDAQAAEPTVPLDAGLEWARMKLARTGQADALQKLPANALPLPQSPTKITQISAGAMEEMSLVHVPLYFFKYQFRDQVYTAVVDAASGTVLANIFPPKAEAPYLLVGIVTAMVYLCAALMAVVGNSGISVTIAVLIGIIAAPILFAWAFMVASRV